MTEAFTWAEGHRLIQEVGSGRWLAQRLRELREQRGWSQAELARQLTEIGYPMHQSAISRIEAPNKDDGRRSITTDDAIAFSKVFGVPLGELLLPPDAFIDAEAWRAFITAAEVRNEMRNLQSRYDDQLPALRRHARERQSFRGRLDAYRREVMAELEQQLRQMHDDDNDRLRVHGKMPRRWSRDVVEANKPPVVIVIDDVLSGQGGKR